MTETIVLDMPIAPTAPFVARNGAGIRPAGAGFF